MKVAIGIICDDNQRILITQRSAAISQGGLWEFPGGKLEPGESPESALIRELQEEVGLEVGAQDFIFEINDNQRSLYVFLVTQYTGQASRRETQQDLRWITPQELNQFEFPSANHKIITWLQDSFIEERCS